MCITVSVHDKMAAIQSENYIEVPLQLHVIMISAYM